MAKSYLLLWILLLFSVEGVAQERSVVASKNDSWVSYRLVHPLHLIEATSKDVLFTATLNTSSKRVVNVVAQVDVMTFDSGNSNRDSHAMEVVDAIGYPDVTFRSASTSEHGDSIHVAGNLTFHGITRNIAASAIATWSPEKLSVRGGFDISLESFKIERPTLLLIPVEDTLRFSFVAVFDIR